MSAIQSANASASKNTTSSQAPQFDFPAALSDYQTQGGQVPLTPSERSHVLAQMLATASDSNNALTNPNPPEMERLMHDLGQYKETAKQLEMLQHLSDEQNSRVQSLQERLQPLSPSGQIPGLPADSEASYFGNSGAGLGEPGSYDLDLDSFVQDQDYFPGDGGVNGGGLPDFNFDSGTPGANGFGGSGGGAFGENGFGGTNNTFGGTSADAFTFGANSNDNTHLNVDGDAGFSNESRVESVSSNATSPAATVEEVEDETRRRSPKRRKQ
jgi:heat shock transcription factor